MSEDNSLKFSFIPEGDGDQVTIHVRFSDGTQYTDRLEITNAEARHRFAASLCEKYPGIPPNDVAQALEKYVDHQVTGDSPRVQEKAKQAQVLVQLAEEVELFHDSQRAFATIKAISQPTTALTNDDGFNQSHYETYPLDSRQFREWLAGQFWTSQGKVPGAQAIQDALNVLAGNAKHRGPRKEVFVRFAFHESELYIDLGNELWQVIRITATEWSVVDHPPVKFIRRGAMLPLPLPERGGSISELRSLVNAQDEHTWCLMVAWLLGSLHPHGPYPILNINGEQGSGKSTVCRMLRGLLDPNAADLRSAPKEERDLMVAAVNARVLAFDNLSSIPLQLSDSLCRLSTRGGFAVRKLFTDQEEEFFCACRPILINGIEDLATRPDLLERSINLHLPAITDLNRLPEAELESRYKAACPRVLGALLDAAVIALRNWNTVTLPKHPRMADFAKWIVAAEPALPWKPGRFLATYAGNQSEANELALEASAIGPSLLSLVERRGRWKGTPKELLAELESTRYSDERTRDRRDWPQSPQSLANRLRRLATVLRSLGIRVEFHPRTSTGIPILLERVGEVGT